MANDRKTNDENLVEILIETILSNRTKEGMVNFTLKKDDEEIVTQWDIQKAKQIRDMLSEAIEAAISDAMIYKFMRERVGLDDERASMVIHDLREVRQGQRRTMGDH